MTFIIFLITAFKYTFFTFINRWGFIGFYSQHFTLNNADTKNPKNMRYNFYKKKICRQKNPKKMKITAFSSQPVFSFFLWKSIFKKLKIGQLFLSNFEVFKKEFKWKKMTFVHLLDNSWIFTYVLYYLIYCGLSRSVGY